MALWLGEGLWSGETWPESERILNMELTGFADVLDVEAKRERSQG